MTPLPLWVEPETWVSWMVTSAPSVMVTLESFSLEPPAITMPVVVSLMVRLPPEVLSFSVVSPEVSLPSVVSSAAASSLLEVSPLMVR